MTRERGCLSNDHQLLPGLSSTLAWKGQPSYTNGQICNFVHEMQHSAVRNVSIQDFFDNESPSPKKIA